MDKRVPVLFDTDIGDDIDDAVALAYLLVQPRCELVGITTVYGAPRKRAALADAMCRAAGRIDIPIRAGAGDPLFVPAHPHTCPQAEILPDFEHADPNSFEPNAAVCFMRETIRSRPGEITLLAVGPMTNVGLLFAMDPEVPRMLKRVVLMCGDFAGQSVAGRYAEWNAQCDPDAAALAYGGSVPEHLSVGLNVTTQCVLDADEAAGRFRETGGCLEVVAAATDLWSRRTPKITFHDPLAAAVIFEPDLVKTGECRVDVERNSPLVRGLTYWDPKAEPAPHKVALDVDPDRFVRHYFETVARLRQGG